MRKLLNTLYITTPDSYLSKDGTNVVVSVNQQEVFRIPIINIEGIVTFGYMGASPGLMKLCTDNNVSLTFLSPNGRYIGRLQGQTRGNVLLRKAQYKLAEQDDWSLHLSQIMIAGKIQNYRNILRRYIRDYGLNPDVELAAKPIHIDEIELTDFNPDTMQMSIRVVCGKGTYIRSLARDIGAALGSGAFLTALCRTRVGDVRIEECLTFDDFPAWLEKEVNSEQ